MPPPDPRAASDPIGHDAASAEFDRAIASGRLHHAWLITGPAGIGKATFAYSIARRLLSQGAAPDGVARRIGAGAHADLFTLERTISRTTKRLRTEIVVDDVRAAGEFLRLTPAEGGWRIVVVDRAEELNRNAANALLKILEEPPRSALLLLVCNAPGRLPPTVRSRCRRLALRPLSNEAMDILLGRLLPDADETERLRLISLAEGSPGRALALAEGEGISVATIVDDVLSTIPGLTPRAAHAVADKLAKPETFSPFMELLRAGIAAAIRETARGHAEPQQIRLTEVHGPARWTAVWQSLGRIQRETEALALDRRQAILQSLSLVNEAAPDPA